MSTNKLSSLQWLTKVRAVLKDETSQIRPKQHFYSLVSRAIPRGVGKELRATLLRLRGIEVGAGTLLCGTPELSGGESRGFGNLSIGSRCTINVGCVFECGDKINIGDQVILGFQVLIITTTHEIGPREHRAGVPIRRPVTIHDGAIIGSRSVILPGVTIGAAATVEPGSVVNRDVAPNTHVRGIPARKVDQ
jgi:acetyltransferase-like isoleucine patch superfamily enzyme